MLWGLQGFGVAYVEIRDEGGERVKVVGLEPGWTGCPRLTTIDIDE